MTQSTPSHTNTTGPAISYGEVNLDTLLQSNHEIEILTGKLSLEIVNSNSNALEKEGAENVCPKLDTINTEKSSDTEGNPQYPNLQTQNDKPEEFSGNKIDVVNDSNMEIMPKSKENSEVQSYSGNISEENKRADTSSSPQNQNYFWREKIPDIITSSAESSSSSSSDNDSFLATSGRYNISEYMKTITRDNMQGRNFDLLLNSIL